MANLRTGLFLLAQGISLTTAVISVSVAPIIGRELAPSPGLSTLPYGAQFATVIACSYLISKAMQRFGRLPVFNFGALSLALAGLCGYWSIAEQSFALNLLSHALFGLSIGSFAFFRFAASEGLDEQAKARALSLVTLGGILAAFVGPWLTATSRPLIDNLPFAASYLCFSALAMLMLVVLALIKRQSQPSTQQAAVNSSTTNNHVATPWLSLSVAVYASGFGYMLMALLMMQASLSLNSQGIGFSEIMVVIQWHVVAMFAPSLIMGRIINRFGEPKVLLGGYAVMLSSMSVAISQPDYNGTLIALIGVGLGWNMLYVGGSSLVAKLPGDAAKLQGINESAVAFLNAAGALSAGLLFQWLGWQFSNWLGILLLMPGVVLLLVWQRRELTVASIAS